MIYRKTREIVGFLPLVLALLVAQAGFADSIPDVLNLLVPKGKPSAFSPVSNFKTGEGQSNNVQKSAVLVDDKSGAPQLLVDKDGKLTDAPPEKLVPPPRSKSPASERQIDLREDPDGPPTNRVAIIAFGRENLGDLCPLEVGTATAKVKGGSEPTYIKSEGCPLVKLIGQGTYGKVYLQINADGSPKIVKVSDESGKVIYEGPVVIKVISFANPDARTVFVEMTAVEAKVSTTVRAALPAGRENLGQYKDNVLNVLGVVEGKFLLEANAVRNNLPPEVPTEIKTDPKLTLMMPYHDQGNLHGVMVSPEGIAKVFGNNPKTVADNANLVAKQIWGAVALIHAGAAVGHYDIKPGNIFVSMKGGKPVAVLGDLGTVREFKTIDENDELSPPDVFGRGTPGYMHPDIKFGAPPNSDTGSNPRFDNYSAAKTLMDLLDHLGVEKSSPLWVAAKHVPKETVEGVSMMDLAKGYGQKLEANPPGSANHEATKQAFAKDFAQNHLKPFLSGPKPQLTRVVLEILGEPEFLLPACKQGGFAALGFDASDSRALHAEAEKLQTFIEGGTYKDQPAFAKHVAEGADGVDIYTPSLDSLPTFQQNLAAIPKPR